MKRILYYFVMATLVMTCASCRHTEEKEHDDDHDHAILEKHPNAVEFTDEMQKAIDFATAEATTQAFGNIIRTVAQVQSSQGDETVLTAKADGIVTLASSDLTEGAQVGVGKAICRIDASQTAGSNLSVLQKQAQAEVQRAKAELDRLEALRKDKLALESEVQNARADYAKAKSELDALQKGGNGGVQTVTATRSGYLKQLLVRNGQYVTTGEAIAVITQSRTLQLKAEVPVAYYQYLSGGVSATIEGKTLEELGGKMLSYGRQTSPDNPLIPVVFEIKNVLNLVPGAYVNMYIKAGTATQRLCVPSTAVLEEMGNNFVYVQVAPEFFDKRQVKTGVTDGISTEILSGIKKGECVVSRGAVMVKLQQVSGSADPEAGHNHN